MSPTAQQTENQFLQSIFRQTKTIWGSLFLRTFVLIALLLIVSLAAWIQSIQVAERTPKARQIAAQVISIVKLTRAALQYSAPQQRHQLLKDLEQDEEIRVYPREKTDVITPGYVNQRVLVEIRQEVISQLGQDTVISPKVNQIEGFWVSFKIADDDYWVLINRDRIERYTKVQFAWWGIAALSLALFGAAFISMFVNHPIKQLAQAAHAIGSGEKIAPLPVGSDSEISQANSNFNQMMSNLAQLDSDRTVMLAGISHDLRTPLARLRLETEMSPIDACTKAAMNEDIEQIDAIISQFMEYSKPEQGKTEVIDLSNLVSESLHRISTLNSNVKVTQTIAPNCWIEANRTDMLRVMNNLIENAERYGASKQGIIEIEVCLQTMHAMSIPDQIILSIADHGEGVPENILQELTRPFFRYEKARSNVKGSGLGLAIVQRCVTRSGGKLYFRRQPAPSTGLIVEILFPAKIVPT